MLGITENEYGIAQAGTVLNSKAPQEWSVRGD